ncbi:MAG TPA: DUF3536 domain-containing protein [Planctomycetota bacterium]|nr:DUF3536 domain-containing protein [Planctomycetota bacterium]
MRRARNVLAAARATLNPKVTAMANSPDQDPQRYAVIHGHFYQPPRENPWIEEVERQEGAQPYHDWNEHITYQCYLPNTASRVIRNNRIIDLVNNYSYISLNFGPTLLLWLEKRFPYVLEGIVEADAVSRAHNNGHGNAIAQVYNHVIMPLENPRDQHTQVIWGIRDFEHRFGRSPEAMWLSETACNIQTLNVLIDHGMKFVILAPNQAEKMKPFDALNQAEKMKPLDAPNWTDVSNGSIDPRRPYRHFMYDKDERRNDNRFIDVFFYDGPLSRNLAFGGLTSSAAACSEAFWKAYGRPEFSPSLVNAAVDGETFGHHHQFSDMCLAYLVKYELPRRKINVTNYARYLELCPPAHEVMIKQGKNGEGTSWSCAHGVGRWKEDCGCSTGRGEFHQKWRAPLRQALRNLRDALVPVYEIEGGKLFHDSWKARDNYIDVINNRTHDNVTRWLTEHMKVEVSKQNRVRAIELLEMQRHAMLMFTSCGWFFDEISRIETVQCMLYAARAAQLCRQLTGHDYEQKLKDDLEAAPSNVPHFGNGKKVYEHVVEPATAEWQKVVAQYAIRLALLPDHPTPNKIYDFHLDGAGTQWQQLDSWTYGVGSAHFFSGITFEEHEGSFFCINFSGGDVKCFVREFTDDEHFGQMRSRIMDQAPDIVEIGLRSIVQEFFSTRAYTLNDLFREDREKVISSLMKEKLQSWKSYFEHIFQGNVGLMKRYHELGWSIPVELRISSQYAVAVELAEKLRESSHDGNLDRVRVMKGMLDFCRSLGFQFDLRESEEVLRAMIMGRINALLRQITIHDASMLKQLLDVAGSMHINYGFYLPQNRMYRLLNDGVLALIERGENREEMADAIETIIAAADMMGFDVERYRQAARKQRGEAANAA